MMTTENSPSYETIRAQAIAEQWTNSKAKKALHAAGLDERIGELVAELRQLFNREVGSATTPKAEPAAAAEVPAPAPLQVVEAAPAPAAAPQHFDNLTIWCDAGENKRRAVVNSYGKKVTYDNGGFVAGLVIEETGEELIRTNSKCRYSLEAEAFAVLKAIEAAIERNAKALLIKSDAIAALNRKISKRQNNGDVYLGVARKIVAESGLQVTFEIVENTSATNKADAFLRRWAGLSPKY